MATHKHIDRICAAATLLTLLLTLLFINGQALGLEPVSDGDSGDGPFTRNDLLGDWDAEGATRIRLTGEGGEITGNGAYFSGGSLHIVYAGRYVLSGELTGGSVIVDADGDDKVWLLLDGVSLRCEEGAALRIEQAKKVFLTLAEGSENQISSGGTYSAEAEEAGVDGAVYSRDDLTVNGSGSLTVTGEYRRGIVCNDDLVMTGGTLLIDAAEDGIHANDSVRLTEASVTINAGDDGVTVSNDEGTGSIYIASGELSIPACCEGLEAVSITIDGGSIAITARDDGINANGQGESVIAINGGRITILNPDGRDGDGLDSNGSIYVRGGELFISVSQDGGNSALDYGVESGGVCEISGGRVIACGSSAMAEGFDAASSQSFLMYTTSAPAPAETTLTLERGDGTVLLSEAIPYGFSSAVLSTPEMTLGEVCTIRVGEKEEQVSIDSSPASSGPGGGGMGPGGGMTGRGPGGMSRFDGGEDFPSGGFTPPGGEEGTAPSGMPTPPEGEEGTAPSGMPAPPEGGTPPTAPQEGEEGETPPAMPQEESAAGMSPEEWGLVGGSVLALLGGLLFAWKKKT